MVECAFCEGELTDLDRCGLCGRGQPVGWGVDASGNGPDGGSVDGPGGVAAPAMPGGVLFLIGVILLVVGAFVPIARPVAWILVLVAAVVFADAVWRKLHSGAPA